MLEKFISWLIAQVGFIYVWGGQGETNITEAWIRKMENSTENANRAIAFWNKQRAAGVKNIAAFDCSGLITEFLLKNNCIQSDMSSRGLFAITDAVTKAELQRGDLVFRHSGSEIYHVGVYIGNGEVIHAKGRDCGVVREPIDYNNSSYWNRFGRLSVISEKVSVESMPAFPKNSIYPKLMEYTGATYINMRTLPDTSANSEVLDKITNGETVLVLNINSNNWADVIKNTGDRFIRGYSSAKWFSDLAAGVF